MQRIGTFLAGLALVAPAAAQQLTFEAYYPNHITATQVYDYLSTAEGQSTWRYEGRLIRTPGPRQSRDGHDYDTVLHRSQGLPDFFPTEWITYHRETATGLFTAQEDKAGRLDENLEFPAKATAGEPWEAPPTSFWSREVPEPVAEVETAAGTFDNCMKVSRRNEDTEQEQVLTNVTTYCPGVGAVHEVTTFDAAQAKTVTEVRLVERRSE